MTSHWRLRLAISGLTALCFAAPGHSAATEHDPGVWAIFSTSDTFSSAETAGRWQYAFDAQARYFDVGSGVNQWLVRPAVGFKVTGAVNAWAGYARFRTRAASGAVADENRYWQQVDWRAGSWQGGQVSMRARLEQRDVSVGDDIGVVLRFMAKYVRPIGARNNSLIVSLEPFVDLRDTDWGGDAGVGQTGRSLA